MESYSVTIILLFQHVLSPYDLCGSIFVYDTMLPSDTYIGLFLKTFFLCFLNLS